MFKSAFHVSENQCCKLLQYVNEVSVRLQAAVPTVPRVQSLIRQVLKLVLSNMEEQSLFKDPINKLTPNSSTVFSTLEPFLYYDADFFNVTLNCSTHNTDVTCMDDEDYIDSIHEYVFPQTLEWVLIVLNVIVLLMGLLGNFLVCYVVYRNTTMQSVTNIFIVNLAVADFCVLLFCLPPTVVWDVTETWFFGNLLCKLILYFQVRIFFFWGTLFLRKLYSKNFNIFLIQEQ